MANQPGRLQRILTGNVVAPAETRKFTSTTNGGEFEATSMRFAAHDPKLNEDGTQPLDNNGYPATVTTYVQVRPTAGMVCTDRDGVIVAFKDLPKGAKLQIEGGYQETTVRKEWKGQMREFTNCVIYAKAVKALIIPVPEPK